MPSAIVRSPKLLPIANIAWMIATSFALAGMPVTKRRSILSQVTAGSLR